MLAVVYNLPKSLSVLLFSHLFCCIVTIGQQVDLLSQTLSGFSCFPYWTDVETSWSVLLCFFCLDTCIWLVPNGFVVVRLISKLEVPDRECGYHLNLSWIKHPQIPDKHCHPSGNCSGKQTCTKLAGTTVLNYTRVHQRPCRICKTACNKCIVIDMKVNYLTWILRTFQCMTVWWHESCLLWLLYLMSCMNSRAQKGRWK